MNKVSIIIPVYNVEEYLERCLDSVVNQTLKDIEIICVNDCSPDNSLEILQDYAAKDDRIKIINREKNGGLSAARNTGIGVAAGEYIGFVDSDDWIDLDYIEKMVAAIEFSKVDIVVNTNVIAEYKDKAKIFPWKKYQKAPKNGEYLTKEQSINVTPCMTWTHLFRKSFLDKYKLKFPEGFIHEDNYFQFISEVWTDRIFAFNGSVYHYWQNDKGIMNLRKNKKILYLKIDNIIYDYYKSNALLYKYDIKICNPKVFISLETEDEYNICKQLFIKLSEYFDKNNKMYDEFDRYIISSVLDTKDFFCYKMEYKIDFRVSFLKSKIQKVENNG